MNPSYPFYFHIDPDQTNLNEAQDRYRPGQLFWRRNQSENHQQIAENTFAATSTVLAPFQPQLQPMFAQAGFSGSLPLAPASTPPPTTLEPQGPSETENPGRAGRGYGKWRDEEERLLVQLWCDKHTRLESRHARQVWEEIAQEVSKIRKVSSTQCQRKVKYLKDRYKEAKDHNRNKTGGERKTSSFYSEIDSVLGCRDIMTFSHVKESGPSSSSSTSSSSSSLAANGKGGSAESAQDDGSVDDQQFEESLAAFGLKRRRERKNQRNERKRTKTGKAPRKEQEEDDTIFREGMQKLQGQGDRITGVLESMEKDQAQQLQVMNQFMNNFMQARQPSNNSQ